MKARLLTVLQALGLVMGITGTFTQKNSNLLPFLLGCFTGLRPKK